MPANPDTARWGARGLWCVVLSAALVAVAVRGGSYDSLARRETFVLAWWSVGLAGALGLIPRTRPSAAARVAVLSLLCLAGWMALGALWSDSVERTIVEGIRTLGLAGITLLLAWSVGPRDWPWAAAGIAVAAIVVCVLALSSRLIPSLLPSAVADAGLDTRRLAYPLNYWNAVGAWAAMTASLALSWSAHAERWWLRGTALAGVCVALPVAYMTYSRTAAVVTLLGVGVVVALSAHRWLAVVHALAAAAGSAVAILVIRANPEIADYTGTAGAAAVALVVVAAAAGCFLVSYLTAIGGVERFRLPLRARVAATVTAVVVVLAFGAFAAPGLAERAWDSFNRPASPTRTADPASRLGNLSGERRALWAVALDSFREQPLRGTGAGTYELAWNRSPEWTHSARDAHSLYLEALAELGLPGLLLVLTALGALLWAALSASFRQTEPPARGAAAGCAAALVVFCVAAGVDWMWESTAVIILALACGIVGGATSARKAPRPSARTRIAVPLLALAALALLFPALLADINLRKSQRALREGRADEAVSAASTALQLQPWSARAYRQRALVLERFGFLAAAGRDAREAADQEPTDYQNWLLVARIDVERGAIGAGLRAARRARSLHPADPRFRG